MIEATCGACGTVNRVSESDVPVGAKFIACASCKSRVTLPTGNLFGPGSAPRGATQPIPSPPAGGNRGDIIDLADLPAPKRQSPLAGAGPSAPAPKRSALELDDLLAPAGPSPGSLPPPIPSVRNAIADLPAPKGKAPGVADLGLAKSTGGIAGGPASRQDISDLPAPKTGSAGLPAASARGAQAIGDLPAPKAPSGMADLPTPPSRQMPSIEDLPAPRPGGPGGIGPSSARGPHNISDLPAPKSSGGGLSDLPAPKGPAGRDLPPARGAAGIADLPAPRGPAGIADLPAPRGSAGIADLPAPRGPAGIADLPAPRGSAGISDLPAPKSGPSNLPTPKVGPGNLPAPKAPTGITDLPMPKPGAAGDLPAPKGFFDDLPQPSQNRGGAPDLPAPKGFFDDLPQPSQNRAPELPAPKGFFDDLPQVSQNRPPELPAPKGFFENLPARGPGQPGNAPLSAAGLFGGDDLAGASGGHQIELGDGGPELALDPTHTSGGYDDLDLSKPSAGLGPRFDSGPALTPQQQLHHQQQQQQRDAVAQLPSLGGRSHQAGDVSLELEEPRLTSQRLAPKSKVKAPDPTVLAAQGKRRKIILGAVLGVALAGGAGFMVYQRHARAEHLAEEVATDLATSRTAMTAADAQHWNRALAAAKKAQELAETDPDALGLGAEAAFAGALDDGQNAPARTAQGNKMINVGREAGASSPALDRAIALAALAAGQGDRALTKLQPLAAAAPTDGFLQLYLGWALALKGDPKAASGAFDQAMAATPATKLPALYARGKAKLALADLDGARADFAAVLAIAKDHIGAQVGLAAATPPSQAAQQEADLLALLQRKDIDTSDPRARVQAWTLAGDDARRGGRLDAARERYRKALALAGNDVNATTGLAETELRDGKLDVAYDLITKAVTAAPNDVRAQLVYCELAIRQGKLDDADARIKTLAAKVPPPTPLELARLGLVKGKLLDARGDVDGALAAWEDGAKAGGELDLSPMMAAIAKLGELAKEAPDPAKAQKLRARADELLGTLADKAQKDPALALTLGTAYLGADDAAKAETWLRHAEDARPKDPEPKFQLAKALTKLARYDEAIEELRGAIELDPSRADIGLELAKTFELAGRDPDAGAEYDALLAAKDPAVELRARAGRFYARTNQMTKAVAQSDEILRLDPTNAAGFYLKGEGLLASGHPDEASRAFQSAVDADPDAQYFDAQGRAAEARGLASGDTKFQELALRAYEQASKLAPAMFNPLAGQGRVLIAHGDWQKALPLLVSANKLRSDDGDVMFNLGRVHQELQLKPAAIAWYVKSEQAAPKAETFHQLAELYSDPDINKPQFAIDSWSRAIDLAVKDEAAGTTVDWLTEAYFQRGLLRGTLGDLHGQKCDYVKFLDRHPAAGARVDEARRDLGTKLLNVPGCP